MEVLVHSPTESPTMTIDHFDFNGARLSPYLSAPSSPKRFGEDFYLSAPTSPSRFYSQFDYFSSSPSTLCDQNAGFAFSINKNSDSSSRSAEELFHGGKLKPFENESFDSAKSPLLSPNNRPRKSSIAKGKKAIFEAFLPKNKKDSSSNEEKRGRGRDRDRKTSEISSSNSGRRVTRSHSPYRETYTWVEQQQNQQEHKQTEINKEDSVSTSKSSRIWRLRDFLLFRSASEGRGSSKDPLRKYSVSYNKKSEEGKGSSGLRSCENIPRCRRKDVGVVSAHELHYARKKAESEDLKKRTFLPYKQGILGKLAGLGSNTR